MPEGAPPAPPAAPPAPPLTDKMTFVFTEQKLGMALEGTGMGKDQVRISKTVEDSPAHAAGIPVGYYLLDVNGVPAMDLNKKKVHALLVNATRPLTIRVQETVPIDLSTKTALILAGQGDKARHVFKKYDDRMTATALVDSLAEHTQAYLKTLSKLGSTTKPPPAESDVVCVGAGMAGICVGIEMVQGGMGVCMLEKSSSAGGVWCWQANSYSRVNSSEPVYRLPRSEHADTYTNHTPAYQIVDSIIAVLQEYSLADNLYKLCTVNSVKPRADGEKGWSVEGISTETNAEFAIKAKLACLATNRRLGTPRELSFPGEERFKGQIARGLNSDAESLDWAHKTAIIGMGAFALEHMRTALERGSPHASILCRRRGTVCPQVVDWVNFVRPVNEATFLKEEKGSAIVQSAWSDIYSKSGATKPECWKEGILKPDGHTVSTSDLFFVAHFLDMAATGLGEIDHFVPDGFVTLDNKKYMCGIVIKCVGFHINPTNERILNRMECRGGALVDDNLWLMVEAHLDSSIFKLASGSSYIAGASMAVKLMHHGYKNPEAMAKWLTTKSQAMVSHFTANDNYEWMLEVIKLTPEVAALQEQVVAKNIANVNKAMSFGEYLDRNETSWAECHEMLAMTNADPAVARKKGKLPYIFSSFKQLVEDEWAAKAARREIKA